MPAAAIPAIVGGAVSAGTSIISAIGAGKRAKNIQQQIDNYKRQELTNPFEGLQVSTLGADRQREDLARTMSTYANLAAMGGSRAIVGLAPNLLAQQSQQEAQIMANLDEQEKQRQQLVANGAMQIQGMQEQRENNDLIGLGNALNTARQEQTNAWNQFGQTAMGLGMAASSGMFDGVFKSAKKEATPYTELSRTTKTHLQDNQNVALPNSVSVFNTPSYYNHGKQVFKTPSFILGFNGMYNPFKLWNNGNTTG
ncbi:hypothetical protein PG616_00940 [Riemerella anatipestifer]|nr:hypothetical protein [Riemerella anatipestifer]